MSALLCPHQLTAQQDLGREGGRTPQAPADTFWPDGFVSSSRDSWRVTGLQRHTLLINKPSLSVLLPECLSAALSSRAGEKWALTEGWSPAGCPEHLCWVHHGPSPGYVPMWGWAAASCVGEICLTSHQSGTSILSQLLDYPSGPWFSTFVKSWSRRRHDTEPTPSMLLSTCSGGGLKAPHISLHQSKGELAVLPVVASGKTQGEIGSSTLSALGLWGVKASWGGGLMGNFIWTDPNTSLTVGQYGLFFESP